MLPVAPSKLKIGFASQNKTLNLINEGEINILKDPGLLEIEFDAMLPNTQYPFSIYKDGFVKADDFIDKINKLKMDKTFSIYRDTDTTRRHCPFNTNIKVSLEEYEMEEDADEGFDVILSIKLKQYKVYGTKKLSLRNLLIMKKLKLKKSKKGNQMLAKL